MLFRSQFYCFALFGLSYKMLTHPLECLHCVLSGECHVYTCPISTILLILPYKRLSQIMCASQMSITLLVTRHVLSLAGQQHKFWSFLWYWCVKTRTCTCLILGESHLLVDDWTLLLYSPDLTDVRRQSFLNLQLLIAVTDIVTVGSCVTCVDSCSCNLISLTLWLEILGTDCFVAYWCVHHQRADSQ